MLKKLGAAAALTLAVGIMPMAGHADPTNACVAQGPAGSSLGVAAFEALTCTYKAGSATGQITQATPNDIEVFYINDENEKVTLYDQGTSIPGQAAFPTPVGEDITVVVGPNSPGFGEGSIGLVIIGDAS